MTKRKGLLPQRPNLHLHANLILQKGWLGKHVVMLYPIIDLLIRRLRALCRDKGASLPRERKRARIWRDRQTSKATLQLNKLKERLHPGSRDGQREAYTLWLLASAVYNKNIPTFITLRAPRIYGFANSASTKVSSVTRQRH